MADSEEPKRPAVRGPDAMPAALSRALRELASARRDSFEAQARLRVVEVHAVRTALGCNHTPRNAGHLLGISTDRLSDILDTLIPSRFANE